jgi:hypothetical protein
MSTDRRKRGRPATSSQLWIQPEMNDEIDVRKYCRAVLALRMHQAAQEAAAQAQNEPAPEADGGAK